MKTLHIFFKSLKEQIRDWRFLSFSLSLAPLFMIVFGFAFRSSYYTYKIVIFNDDQGVVDSTSQENQVINFGDLLVQTLQEVRYDEKTKIYKLVDMSSEQEAQKKLESHEIAALIRIPEGFSNAIASSRQAGELDGKTLQQSGGTVDVVVSGDPAYTAFGVVNMVFEGIFNDFVLSYVGFNPPVVNRTEYIGVEQGFTEFDYLAPGIMLMSIFILIIQSAVVIMREIESGTILRFQMARLQTWQFLAGVGGTQVLFSIVMVPVMFGVAILMGFNIHGSLILGIIVGVVTCISAVAMGLITAAFSRTAGEAFIVGNFMLVPAVFLSGVFFPLPENGFVTIFGHSITVFMLQPATHAVNAFLSIFLADAGLGDILFELVMILVLSAIYFAVGVFLFKRAHFRTRYQQK
jgi:ABC-2 type transport system permease protein